MSGITYGVDAIEQFQVVTSGAQAELGRALGGYVNVVTKSGTNVLHGTVYDYFRDDRFNARERAVGHEAADGPGAVRRQSRAGRSSRTARSTSRTSSSDGSIRPASTTISTPTCAAINARLAAVGYRGPLITTGVYPNPVDTTNVLAKVDHQVSGRDQFSVRYSLYDVDAENSRGAGGLNAPSASSATRQP